MKRLFIAAFVVCGLLPSMLCAQDKDSEKRKFGLTFPSIGFIMRISDRVAFLPSIDFGHSWTTYSDDRDDSKSNSLGINAALRFYVHDWKGMRFYVSPKYGYGWNKSDTSLQGSRVESHTDTHSVTGAWGVEYAVSNRISLFGDIGAKYSRATQDSSSPYSSDIKGYSVGTVGSWGLILYLK